MGGREGYKALPAPLFLSWNYYQIKSLLFIQFFTASIPDCFLSYMCSVLAKAEVIRASP